MSETPTQAWELSDTELFTQYGEAFVPRRKEQAAIVCDLLARMPRPAVLDLGCGEGRLAEEVLRRFPDAHVTVLDAAPEMLAMAEQRLRRFGQERFRIVQARLEDSGWRQGASYGGVITSLAVHHLDGPGKQALYRDVRALLAPGGVFVMADLIEPATPVTRSLAAACWNDAVRQASLEIFGGPEAATAFQQSQWNYFELPGPDEVDKPSSVAEHLDWLRQAGFTGVDVAWLYAGHAIFTATRPEVP